MPDGIAEVAPVFTQNDDGTYQSVSTVGATSITTSYNENFEKTGTVVSKTYETVLSLDEMTAKFQDAWGNVADQLPAEFLNSESPVQFALDGNQWLAIATADAGEVLNGDIVGRITSWDNEGNEGTWTRWMYDALAEQHKEFDVESSDWSFNFHDADWNYVARSGGREVTLIKETGTDVLLNGGEGEVDETGTHTQIMVQKDEVSEDLWGELTSLLSDSILGLMADGADVSSVENLRIEENAWSGQENAYRAADETWSDSETRTEIYGDLGNGSNIFLGSVTKRDGFVVVRDDAWNEVARLIDPDAEGTGYSDMAAKYDGFADAWSEIGDELPSAFKDDEGNTIEEELSYTTDQWDNILVFSQAGEMIGRINQWSYTDTWDRSWDDEFPQETFSNKNFEFRVVTDDGDYDVGRFESGYKTLINTDGNAVTESQWTQVYVSVIERNSEAEAWAANDVAYFEGTVATALGVAWEDVDRIEISNNNYTYNPVGWREELETESSTSVRFYSEEPQGDDVDNPDWYRSTLLGSVEKRDGFIEVRDENWDTVARIADLAGDNIKDWAFIETQYDGIKEAWDSVAEFLPANLSAYANLKYTVDDRHVYAFTAAGEMVGQINFWSGEDTWMRYFGDDLVSIKNINYNYNFHDADWNNLANSGGNERYIVGEDGSLILDEKGSHSGVNVRKEDLSADDWAYYEPDVGDAGFIEWADVTEIRQQSNSWESISLNNPYRSDDETWSDSNEQIQYYQEAMDGDTGLGWNEFAGSMEIREGFIEFRDETWTIVAQRINATDDNPALTFEALSAEYSGIANAWTALTLPENLAEAGDLQFTTDKWDNVLIFDDTGAMVGKVDFWTHTNTWDRPWDEDYPSETYTNANYNFQIIEYNDNGWNWLDVGRYEVGNTKFNITDDNGNPAQVLNDSWTEVSSTVFERSDPDSFASLGTDTFPDLAAAALNFTWDTVDKVEISSSTRVHSDEIMWRESEETSTSTSVRLYEEESVNGDYYHSHFLGSIEKFDGFIEVRDSSWNVVFQGLDLTDSDSLMEWSEVIAAYDGLDDAWENVEDFFADERLRADDLKFTTDESTIYAFTGTGVMIGQINYWTGSHEYTRFYDDQLYTVRAVDYNYSFHDDNWQQLANSSGNKRYIVTTDENGAEVLVLDEKGSNVGFTMYVNDIDEDSWSDYDPEDDTGTIDFDSVTEIRYETRTWESVDNEFRQIKDDNGDPVLDDDDNPTFEEGWSDDSIQIRYYEESADGSRTEFSGTKEWRDGFVEIRDEHWNTVSQKIDGGGLTFADMVAKYQGFEEAWNALEGTLPSEFRDTVPESDDFGNHLGESFKYTVDKWDNILIFDTDGVMIGKVNYWSHSDTYDRSWDTEYVEETHFNSNFNFQTIQANDGGGTNWIDAGSYEVGSNTYISYEDDGSAVETPQREWVGVGSTAYATSSAPAAWAGYETQHYLEILNTELGFTWGDVGKIEVSSDTSTYHAVGWRDEQEVFTSERVKFYREVPGDDDGNWYHSEFLGSIDKRDGVIEIRDANWNTVASFVDINDASTFDEISSQFDGLAVAWEKVSEYLPDAAVNTDSLSFTSDDHNIFVFDTNGIMIMQLGQWSWSYSHENGDGVLIEESGFGFDFNDDNWNRYASYRADQEMVSDDGDNPTPTKDRTSETVQYRVKKADVSASEWAEYDPGDDSGTINWADISEVSIGQNSWASHANFDRTEDETYSSSEDRTEYFIEVENSWGDTFPQFVGAKEVQGNLARIYNSEWMLVDTDVSGELDGALLLTVLNGADAELIRIFESTLANYIDLETAEIIDSENGPSVLVVDGEIFGTVRAEDNFEDSGTQLYWSYDVQDVNGDNVIRMGGWNAVSEAYNPNTIIAKPNGVSLSEFTYKEAVDAETWEQLKTQYSIDVEGFDWDEVGIIEKQVWKNDWEGDGDYTTREDIRFIKVDEASGRQIWDYFRLEIEGSAITIKNSANEVVGQSVVGDVDDLPSLSDESLLGPEFEDAFEFLKTQFETELNLEIDGFTDGSIGYAGEEAVIWSSADGQEIRVGDLHINDDDDKTYFHVQFKNNEGEHEFEIGGHVNTDSDGKFLFTDYDVFFADYAYKTDTAAWDALLATNGPIDANAIVMDNVEVLQHRISYEDFSGSGVLEFHREELRFLKGEVRDDYVQINWDWETDDRIVFQDGFEKHYNGEYLVSSSISRDTSLVTTEAVWDDVDGYDFIDFQNLLLAEGTFSTHIGAAESLKLATNEDNDKLYVFQLNDEESEELSLIVTNSSPAWAEEFGAEKGYEFMHGDGQYAGWVYSEIENTFRDAAGDEHSNVSLVSSQLYFNSEGSSLSLAAWKFIHDQFDTAESANYEFYDLTAVGLRSVERTWTVDGVEYTNERVLVNHRLDSGWQDMVGFERTISDDGGTVVEGDYTEITISRSPDPDETWADAVSLGAANQAVAAYAIAGFEASIDSVLNGVPFDDSVVLATIPPGGPDAVMDLAMDAEGFEEALVSLEDLYGLSAEGDHQGDSINVSQGGIDQDSGGEAVPLASPEVVVSDDDMGVTITMNGEEDEHVVSITSTSSGFGSSLQTYITNANTSLVDIVDFMDSFVAAAIGEENLTDLAYSAVYSYDDDVEDEVDAIEVRTLSISDAGVMNVYEPITDSDGNIFLVNFESATTDDLHFNIFTADGVFNLDVDGAETLVGYAMAEDDNLTLDQAIELTVEDLISEIIGGEDEVDPFFV